MEDSELTLDGFEDYRPKQIRFKYDGKDYVLRPGSGATCNEYRKAQTRGAKLVDGKVTSDMTGMIEAELILIGGCVFEKDSDKPVGVDRARSFPNPLIEKLYEKARMLSFVKDAAEGDDPKKSPSDSTGGSGSGDSTG